MKTFKESLSPSSSSSSSSSSLINLTDNFINRFLWFLSNGKTLLDDLSEFERPQLSIILLLLFSSESWNHGRENCSSLVMNIKLTKKIDDDDDDESEIYSVKC